MRGLAADLDPGFLWLGLVAADLYERELEDLLDDWHVPAAAVAF